VTVRRLDVDQDRQVATDPSVISGDARPLPVDEEQRVHPTWDTVRRLVDAHPATTTTQPYIELHPRSTSSATFLRGSGPTTTSVP
jgi:hypothetical protein